MFVRDFRSRDFGQPRPKSAAATEALPLNADGYESFWAPARAAQAGAKSTSKLSSQAIQSVVVGGFRAAFGGLRVAACDVWAYG